MGRWIDILHVATPGFGQMPRQQRIAVVQEVADRHGVSLEAVLGASRGREVVAARWEAMRRIHNEFGDSTPRIGRLFNRDHTTVLHALKEVKNDQF